MRTKSIYIIALFLLVLIHPISSYGQMPEDTGDRYIRVAEIGELADSVNVWGDVGSSGRYIIPETMPIPIGQKLRLR